MTEYKACSRCKQIKPFSQFGKSKTTKSGVVARCLVCNRETDKLRYPNRRDERIEYLTNWRAENQDYIKQYRIDYYSKHSIALRKKSMDWYFNNIEQAKATRKLYAIENAEYLALMALQWSRANKDKVAARNKRYKATNPEKAREYHARRRALMYENGVYFIRHKELKRLYSKPCIYCGCKSNIEADHALPIKRSGSHSIGNLLPACRSCNGSKSNKTIMEWRIWKRKNGM